MLSFQKVLRSTLFKKYVMALTGLGLVFFVITHLVGNALLYLPNGNSFNAYALGMEKLGKILWALELGLFVAFLVHVIDALMLKASHVAARPDGYKAYRSKKGPSKSNAASKYMIVSGTVLFVFVVLHVLHLKLGPGIDKGYVTQINGEQARDLHRWVVEEFHRPLIVALYVGVMLFLGMHIRHGFWSAFQSLGAVSGRMSLKVYGLSFLLAIVLAGGFLFIPVWIYFGWGGH